MSELLNALEDVFRKRAVLAGAVEAFDGAEHTAIKLARRDLASAEARFADAMAGTINAHIAARVSPSVLMPK